MSRDRPRVVVVGAGLAGLRCAQRLAEPTDVVLLEAQDRVGGRCWSSRGWADGQVAEHGGELIEEGQSHVLGVIDEFGLTLESRSGGPRGIRILRDGRVHDAADVHGFSAFLGSLDRLRTAVGPVTYKSPSADLWALDEMTAGEWLDANVDGGCGSDLGASVDLSTGVTFGLDTDELSAVSLIHLWRGLPEIDDPAGGFNFGRDVAADDDEEVTFADASASDVVDACHVAGGNDLIATGLADRLPAGCLHLNSPVASVVAMTDGRYEVAVVGGKQVYRADHVVLAAPMPALRQIDLTAAGLSALRHRAIAELPMGRNCKLLVQLDTQPSAVDSWPGFAMFDEPASAVWDTSQGQPGEAGILTFFTEGLVFASAGGGHGPAGAEARHRLAQLMAQVAPGAEARLRGDLWLDSWPDDPWTGGSYAAYAPGQYSRYAGFLSQAEGNVHFAGEHTQLASFGYLDGAIASGERAAAEVLAALGSPWSAAVHE